MRMDTRTSPDCVGRRREIAELVHALDDALASRGRRVMLAGEAGIATTRVAEDGTSPAGDSSRTSRRVRTS